jgi:hypothetical protein
VTKNESCDDYVATCKDELNKSKSSVIIIGAFRPRVTSI